MFDTRPEQVSTNLELESPIRCGELVREVGGAPDPSARRATRLPPLLSTRRGHEKEPNPQAQVHVLTQSTLFPY